MMSEDYLMTGSPCLTVFTECAGSIALLGAGCSLFVVLGGVLVRTEDLIAGKIYINGIATYRTTAYTPVIGLSCLKIVSYRLAVISVNQRIFLSVEQISVGHFPFIIQREGKGSVNRRNKFDISHAVGLNVNLNGFAGIDDVLFVFYNLNVESRRLVLIGNRKGAGADFT